MTPREALRAAMPALRRAAGEDAASCARHLMAEALETGAAGYALLLDDPMTPAQQRRFLAMAERCAAGEPVQYVLGWWEFGGLRLRTDPRALIPRPETEFAARRAAALAEPGQAVIDVGCGSGCIGLYIASRRPDLRLTLCDKSPDALDLARFNAAALELTAEFVCADMAFPLPGGPYGLIVSNPPYVERSAIGALPAVVRDHEPLAALDGGPDGLDAYRMLAARLKDSLMPGGWMVLEAGAGQAEAVAGMLAPWCGAMDIEDDFAGIPRVVTARRRRDGLV